jgi:hypothetical protein
MGTVSCRLHFDNVVVHSDPCADVVSKRGFVGPVGLFDGFPHNDNTTKRNIAVDLGDLDESWQVQRLLMLSDRIHLQRSIINLPPQ